eukprot:5898333-Pleurochrysis_carterae.AAC.2
MICCKQNSLRALLIIASHPRQTNCPSSLNCSLKSSDEECRDTKEGHGATALNIESASTNESARVRAEKVLKSYFSRPLVQELCYPDPVIALVHSASNISYGGPAGLAC